MASMNKDDQDKTLRRPGRGRLVRSAWYPADVGIPGDVGDANAATAQDVAVGAAGKPAGPRAVYPPPLIDRAIKTSERIAAAIVSEIISLELKPGDRLPNEAAMVEQFRVGRGSLREALRILEVHGLISLRSGPGGGPEVIAVNPRDVARTFSLYLHLSRATIRELTEARLFLEPMIARMAAETREPEGMKRLQEALDYEASVPKGDPRYIFAGNNFHYVLATMSGNAVIDLMATALKELYTSRVVGGGLVNDLDQEKLRGDHRKIGMAIIEGDPEKAERLARQHTQYYLGKVVRIPGFAESTITWG
jgi:GntR family transcriptional regulator, transcriptional repressor for pyruvate dehydrogenase complex